MLFLNQLSALFLRRHNKESTKLWNKFLIKPNRKKNKLGIITFSVASLLSGAKPDFTATAVDQIQTDVQIIYRQKIAETIRQDGALASIHAQADQIAQNLTKDRQSIADLSYTKHLRNISVLSPDEPEHELVRTKELTGGLLLGKVLVAIDGITGDPQKKTEAALNALTEILHEEGELSQSEINSRFNHELQSRLGTSVALPQDLYLTREVAAAKMARSKYTLKAGEEEEVWSLPIPGLTFLDTLGQQQIVGNSQIYSLLKNSASLDASFETFQRQWRQKLAEYKKQNEIRLNPSSNRSTKEAALKQMRQLQKQGVYEDWEKLNQ